MFDLVTTIKVDGKKIAWTQTEELNADEKSMWTPLFNLTVGFTEVVQTVSRTREGRGSLLSNRYTVTTRDDFRIKMGSDVSYF